MRKDAQEQPDGIADAGLGVMAGALGSTAAVALLGTGTAGAIVGGVAPPALVLGVKAYGWAVARRQRQAGHAMEVAATCLGGLNILEERLASHDERVELLARVLEAAGRSNLDAKVRALGRVLADGVRDGGNVDEAFALAAALGDLDAVHVLVLTFLADNPIPSVEVRRRKEENVEPQGWERSELVDALPEYASLAVQVVAVLARHGLISDVRGLTWGTVGPAVYRLAPLGMRCLFLLHDDEVQRPTAR